MVAINISSFEICGFGIPLYIFYSNIFHELFIYSNCVKSVSFLCTRAAVAIVDILVLFMYNNMVG